MSLSNVVKHGGAHETPVDRGLCEDTGSSRVTMSLVRIRLGEEEV